MPIEAFAARVIRRSRVMVKTGLYAKVVPIAIFFAMTQKNGHAPDATRKASILSIKIRFKSPYLSLTRQANL